MQMFPSTILPFNRLLDSLLENSSRSADHRSGSASPRGSARNRYPRPPGKGWRASCLRDPSNKNVFRALRQLEEVVQKRRGIVKGRVIATTWTEPGEDPGLLERRRSYLMSGMMTWGEAVMTDAPYNRARLCETVAGMTVQAEVPRLDRPARRSRSDAAVPPHAPIFKQGQSMLVTPDGKPSPTRHSRPSSCSG